MEPRKIQMVRAGVPAVDGAGVKLKRIFGFNDTKVLDPFLMMDDFGSDDPRDYMAGFPWHPHRGMETVTYMIEGEAEHQDSLGNKGLLKSGGIQWMTAGSGIIHQEMPKESPTGRNRGFQLWVNLPAKQKMMPPRYQDISPKEVPVAERDGGIRIKVLAGEVDGVSGPIKGIVAEPGYLDVFMPENTSTEFTVPETHNAFAYVFEGRGYLDAENEQPLKDGKLVIFGSGDFVVASTTDSPMRFILVHGKPIGEPVAWSGPVVMNTQEELQQAFMEMQKGTFVKG